MKGVDIPCVFKFFEVHDYMSFSICWQGEDAGAQGQF